MANSTETIERAMVKPQRVRGSLTVRLPKHTVKDFFNDFHVGKELLFGTDIDNYLIGHLDFDTNEIQLIHDLEECPFHHYKHWQLVPQRGEPMTCAEAMKMEGKE